MINGHLLDPETHKPKKDLATGGYKIKLTGIAAVKLGGGGGGSGHVPQGRYAMKCIRAVFEANKKEDGANLHTAFEIVEPAKYAGIPIHNTTAVAGAYDDTWDFTRQFLIRLIKSVASVDEAKLAKWDSTTEDYDLDPAIFVGKTIFADLVDGKGEYANRSEIKFISTADEFKARPGPKDGEVAPVQAQQSSPPPDLATPPASGGKNGVAATGGKAGKNKVDDMLGL